MRRFRRVINVMVLLKKKKKQTESRPGHGSTRFCQVVVPAGFLTNSNRSSHRVPDRPAGPGLIIVVCSTTWNKLCITLFSNLVM